MRSHGDCHTSGTVGAQWPMRAGLVPSRVNDSDDLVMTESEVGKIALHIEKEMFNLFQVTDNRYKSRYRSIMFNLKDPKNQVCAGSPVWGLPAAGFSGRSSRRSPGHSIWKLLSCRMSHKAAAAPFLGWGCGFTRARAMPGLTSRFSSQRDCEVRFLPFHWLPSNIHGLSLKCRSVSVLGLQTAFCILIPSPRLSEPAGLALLEQRSVLLIAPCGAPAWAGAVLTWGGSRVFLAAVGGQCSPAAVETGVPGKALATCPVGSSRRPGLASSGLPTAAPPATCAQERSLTSRPP